MAHLADPTDCWGTLTECGRHEKVIGRLFASRMAGSFRVTSSPLVMSVVTRVTQAEPVGRGRGADACGHVQHDGLARPRAAWPTERRLRLPRARPNAFQPSRLIYSRNEPVVVVLYRRALLFSRGHVTRSRATSFPEGSPGLAGQNYTARMACRICHIDNRPWVARTPRSHTPPVPVLSPDRTRCIT